MNEIPKLKAQIVSRFSISGFQIRSEASILLAQHLASLPTADRKEWLNNIANHIQGQSLNLPVVEKKHIELAITEGSNSDLDSNETVFSVINAFDVPKFNYCDEKKKFLPGAGRSGLFPGSEVKAEYMRERYKVLWQITSRHELFNPNKNSKDKPVKQLSLRKIETLLSASKANDVVILGLLTQLTEGKFFLEDPTGVVPIDLSHAVYSSGFFCEGSFVLACGKYSDGTLEVYEMGFPISEPGSSSRAYFGTVNTWGGRSKSLLKYSDKLARLEGTKHEECLVFLSDCWLDNPTVMGKLEQLLQGFNEAAPIAIVLMGPFASRTNENIYSLKSHFRALGEILSICDNLKTKSDVVLVPSSDDPAAGSILPRPPLPECIAGELRKYFPRIVLATNPCRLQYCTQQIVVCRVDLVTKLCRNTIHFPTSGQLEDHFARTLISQGTLAPLHPIALPIHWNYDAALSLYPLPDLVVIGDPCQGFQTTEQECTVMNTGSFPKSKFAFKVYIPFSRTVEDSQIPDDD
ncbi:DNA polymerase epsilon subunit 2 [Toxorhynchites rutilus septentrionalis]|uniref:DNA polymerase epsilon subunit 2 n=1 Tax=Toxorhynchites rutilus septentrionalis TaxID=329112 RepID=UPI002479A035|nr:DNA polymerase epsilon subunit 2 [Toxorhynchites rutilus septentrionalis]